MSGRQVVGFVSGLGLFVWGSGFVSGLGLVVSGDRDRRLRNGVVRRRPGRLRRSLLVARRRLRRSRFGIRRVAALGRAGAGSHGRAAPLRGPRRGRMGVRVQLLGDLVQAVLPLLGLALAAGQVGREVVGHAGEDLNGAAEVQAVGLAPLVGVHRRLADAHRQALRAVTRTVGQNLGEVVEVRQLAVAAAHQRHSGRLGRQSRRCRLGSEAAPVDHHGQLVLGDRPQVESEVGEGAEDAPRSGGTRRGRHHMEVLEQHVLGVVDQMVAQNRHARGDERRRPGRELDPQVVAQRPPGGIQLDEQHLAAR